MEYKKIVKDNYNLHIINTNKFKTVNIRINFKRKIKKEEITIRNFLNDLLINSSKKYPTTRDVEIETEELYDLGVSSSSYKSGNYHIMSFSSVFLNEKYTEKNMIYKSIQFLLELIFNPNVENKQFNKKYFDLIKETLEDTIKSVKDDPRKYSLIRLYEEMDNGPLSYRSNGYLEYLDKITPDNLFEYYKSVIENDKIDIFIIGELNEPYIELFDKYIPNTIRIMDRNSHLLRLEQQDQKEIKENLNVTQSKLAIGLKLFDLTPFELQYVLSIYSTILGGSPDSCLFKEVREKHSLCYYINSTASLVSSMITIQAGINGKDYDEAINLIKQEMDKIKEGQFEEEMLEKAKHIYINGCREIYDSPSSIISNYLSHEYLGLDLVEEKIKEVEKVTKEQIISLANKIEIDTIFLLEGDENEEGNSL